MIENGFAKRPQQNNSERKNITCNQSISFAKKLSKEQIEFRQDYILFDIIYRRMKAELKISPELSPSMKLLPPIDCNEVENIKTDIEIFKEKNEQLGTVLENIFNVFNF